MGTLRFALKVVGKNAIVMVNPRSIKNLRMCVRHTHIYFFNRALAPRWAHTQLVECRHPCLGLSGQVRPRQGTEICNFGAPSPLKALHWIFCFFSSVYVQFRKTSPLKSGESSEKSSGENRVKSCHVCGCHGFFGLEIRRRLNRLENNLVWPNGEQGVLAGFPGLREGRGMEEALELNVWWAKWPV